MQKETEIKLRASRETLLALREHPLLKKRNKSGWQLSKKRKRPSSEQQDGASSSSSSSVSSSSSSSSSSTVDDCSICRLVKPLPVLSQKVCRHAPR